MKAKDLMKKYHSCFESAATRWEDELAVMFLSANTGIRLGEGELVVQTELIKIAGVIEFLARCDLITTSQAEDLCMLLNEIETGVYADGPGGED